VVAAILLGQGDAGQWNTATHIISSKRIDVVENNPEVNITEQIPVGLLKYSENKDPRPGLS
jgi:hypothetical protein